MVQKSKVIEKHLWFLLVIKCGIEYPNDLNTKFMLAILNLVESVTRQNCHNSWCIRCLDDVLAGHAPFIVCNLLSTTEAPRKKKLVEPEGRLCKQVGFLQH